MDKLFAFETWHQFDIEVVYGYSVTKRGLEMI